MVDSINWEDFSYISIDETGSYPNINIESFDCGDEGLNNFLKYRSKTYHDTMMCATTLLFNKNTNKIIAYYSLKNSCMFFTQSDIDENRNAIPSTEIVMLAIDKEYQGLGMGSEILRTIIYEVTECSLSFSSSKAITLYALDNNKCIEFYEKSNFKKLDDFMGLVYDECRNVTVPMYLRLA